MHPLWIWLAALVLYGGFSLWYHDWRGPLTPEEIDAYAARMEGAPGMDPERRADLRAFLESDDGGELFMLNLVRLHPGTVENPDSGAREPARDVLGVYTRRFLPGVFRRAGHPVFVGPAAGRYVEHWGVEPDPGWTFSGIIRYRSRRDLMELATAPEFGPAHAYKIAAMASTLAFPVAPARVFFGPPVWVGLALGLGAALAHLAVQAGRASG